jgi:hypothetical protein
VPLAAALLVGSLAATPAAEVDPAADFCESATVEDARAFGWGTEAVNGSPALGVTRDAKAGHYAVKADGKDLMGEWGTLVLNREVDLSRATKGDRIVFHAKQNSSSGLYLNIGGIHRSFPIGRDEWTRIELDLDPAQWTWTNPPAVWGRASRFAFYAREFDAAGEYLIIDGLSFHLGGGQIPSGIPPPTAPPPLAVAEASVVPAPPAPVVRAAAAPVPPLSEAWAREAAAKPFPQENEEAWLLGSPEAFWAISKRTGGILGGWYAPRRERCLEAVEGAYFVEDRQDLRQAVESADAVVEARFTAPGEELQITCTNAVLPDLRIAKAYSVQGNTLARRLGFSSTGAASLFFSYRSEARLDPAFREAGSYVGAGTVGPIEAAAEITAAKQPMFYINSRGMILSNPVRGISLAHYRLTQDGQFLLPWWSYSRAESAKDSFYYTPTGWKLPFGISGLQPGGAVSYEEHLTLAEGNYHDVVTRHYGAREEVRRDLESLGPVPDWLADVKVYCTDGGMDGREYKDFNNVRRLVELTDEGIILVLVNIAGHNVGDYYVDQGLVGLHGGWITGPELQEWLHKLKAISPRVKVGIYCYMDMACGGARLCQEHPEWFRARDKEGNPVNHFAGFSDSRTSMLNRPECREALLGQYDLIFRYLGVDFVYLDDAMTNNLVNWETGEVLRDADCYEFFRGVRRVAARHGPDKMVFFNGSGNPYGDLEFIEAYTRLRADFWRPFAGVGLGVEIFLVNRPAVRVIPLYWTPPLGREYINRVLALGWIPALEYTPVVDGRPFVSAAYEIGNADPINADYQPDWRKERDLKLESYAMRRLGDTTALLSFISYDEAPSRQHLRVRTDSLGLDRRKPLYAWLYRIRDATAYQGYTSERLAKAIYAEAGWTVDLVTTPECRYAGHFADELDLELDLAPFALTMLAVGNEAAAFYSLDGLPQNFLFPKTRGADLRAEVDPERRRITVDVDCRRDRCEVVAFPSRDWGESSVALDGQPVTATWVALGEVVCPVVTVGRGRHRIDLRGAAQATPPVALGGITAAVNGTSIQIRLPEVPATATAALVTVRQDGHCLFSRMVAMDQGRCRVPVPPLRGGGAELAVSAVMLPAGPARATCAPVVLALPQNLPELPLTPLSPGTIPEQLVTTEVNRTILGLEVLSLARQTTATTVPPFQTELAGLTVDVSPETLTIDAGTTRKIEGYLGAAFGGFEVEALKTVRIQLENSYFGAPHINGPNTHTHLYYPTPRLFAGFMVDYHSAAGYCKRVALSVGVVHPDCSTPYPSYGKAGKPDQVVDLGPIVAQGPAKEFALDLSLYAPEGWDGQVWFSAGSDWALAGRRLQARLVAANQPLAAAALRGQDPSLIRKAFLTKNTRLTAMRAAAALTIDGKPAEPAWQDAPSTDDFATVGGLALPTVKTTARLLYDDEYLYIAVHCEEPKRTKPLAGKGDIWRDDEIEIYLDPENGRKAYKQVIINAGGETLELARPGSTITVGTRAKASLEPGVSWTIEAAIPFRGLGKVPVPGESWGLNLCRYRPEGAGFPLELITWAPTESGFGGDEVAKFGTLTFR